MNLNKKCENCNKKPFKTTMNSNGDIYSLCKKCYNKLKYGICE